MTSLRHFITVSVGLVAIYAYASFPVHAVVPQSELLHQATVELTDAQIKALPTTRIEVVPAPGSDKVLVFDSAVLISSIVAHYTNMQSMDTDTAGTLSITASDGDDMIVSALARSGWVLLSSRLAFLPAQMDPTPNTAWLLGTLDSSGNKGFYLQAYNSGDFTGGDPANLLRVSITYRILNTTTGVYE